MSSNGGDTHINLHQNKFISLAVYTEADISLSSCLVPMQCKLLLQRLRVVRLQVWAINSHCWWHRFCGYLKRFQPAPKLLSGVSLSSHGWSNLIQNLHSLARKAFFFYTTMRKKQKKTKPCIILEVPGVKIFGNWIVPEDQTLNLLESSRDKKLIPFLLVISNIPGELLKILHHYLDILVTEELWTLLLQNSWAPCTTISSVRVYPDH